MIEQNLNSIICALGGLFIFLLIWNIMLQVGFLSLKKNQKILFGGKTGKDLEKILLDNNAQIKETSGKVQDLYEITNQINTLASRGLHKTGMIRFNPFRDIGGDQSFSLALLDGKNNGVVVSSLYSRDGVRVYAKSILNGISEKYPLTQEEKYALSIASIDKNNQKSKRSL